MIGHKAISLALLASNLVLASTSWAQPSAPTCNAAAQEKKLAGAAKTSFVTKCQREATERCEAVATERKLVGAAKTSNVKKCVKDAVGE